MKRLIIVLILGLCAFSASNAQVTMWENYSKNHSPKSLSADTTDTILSAQDESLYIPESLDSNVEELRNRWHAKYYTKDRSDNKKASYAGSYAPDSVYINRLARLPRVINLPYNEVVRSCIDLYANRRSSLVECMLGLADFYFPMIEQALDSNDLPLELKYLAIVESALNPTALSRAGASGLWQFMLPTGKGYGLEINSLVDERRDPVKATYAACQYFKDMYAIYNDWDLVIAAYNCGQGNVNKAINRANGKRDFWEIYPYLPRETRSYVPLFIAANYIMNYYPEHGIYPIQAALPLSTDTVTIDKQVHFDQIAAVLKIDKETLRTLNPQYKRDIIPGNAKPCSLLLPSTYAYSYYTYSDSIVKHRSDELFANMLKGPETSKNGNEKVYYRVKPGETALTIANKYGVTASQVRKWNNLRSNKLKGKKSLVLYVDNGGYNLAEKSSKSNDDDEPKGKQEPKTASKKAINISNDSYKKYKVRNGDSLYTISKNFPGTSAKDLMKLNNMSNSALKVGQIIKVPQV